MPLSWNEIKDRALQFSREWADAESEDAEGQTFLNEFFNVFGVPRRRVATFESKTKKLDGKDGYIDLLWKGKLLIEQKSRGKDLNRAYTQAKEYFPGIKDHDLPRYILVSDFARFRLTDLETDEEHEFRIKDFPKHVKLFGFLAGYTTHVFKDEDPVNIRAAERMGFLHDELKKGGFEGHALEVLLVRLLFCLFADDTGIFPPSQFHDLISNKSREDGSDLGPMLAKVFQTLNSATANRQAALDEDFQALPHVNGKLFEESLPLADFTAKTREILLEACALDWSAISPAIFGALFQSVMDPKMRRNLGAHYTSEKNILRLIGPLFLDELREELGRIGNDQNKLNVLHKGIAKMKFLDPACGCGNFLVIAYRELRLLEIEILRRLFMRQKSAFSAVADHVVLNVDQFYGIEIDEFPAQIAQVAMWLVDHQMNQRLSDVFEENFARLPLVASPTIKVGNALRIDWATICAPGELGFILGNPPFVGHQWRTPDQMSDMEVIWGSEGRFGRLDYVTCWYRKAVAMMEVNSRIQTALVSTNSISQGEQVAILWGELLSHGVHINFAHRTFQWKNEGHGVAAVHCVIVGFGIREYKNKRLFDYESLNGEPTECRVSRINPYLVEGPTVLLPSRSDPLPGSLQMIKGSQPTDGGNLILDDEEMQSLIALEPEARKFLRPYVGGEELINGGWRWCLWLKEAAPAELRKLPRVMERVERVRESRLKSPTKSVREYADKPTLFTQDRQPHVPYLAVPEVSSENRRYIPIGFLPPEVVASNKLQIIEGATIYHFGILSSTMHMSWVRAVSGRLKSDYSYSPAVFHNFPWPDFPTGKNLKSIENLAQSVLDTRAKFASSTLADLYHPLTMPPDLVKAHQELDRAVDATYGKTNFRSDAERVAFLFSRYEVLTSFLPNESPKTKTKRNRKVASK